MPGDPGAWELSSALADSLYEDRESDFSGNIIAESTAYFFFILLNLIFTSFIEIKIFEKQFITWQEFWILSILKQLKWPKFVMWSDLKISFNFLKN